jgi:hypothetical protein
LWNNSEKWWDKKLPDHITPQNKISSTTETNSLYGDLRLKQNVKIPAEVIDLKWLF